MHTLPIFPLDTVLFPGLPLQLHIFEPRYQEMIGHCIQTDTPFGVVLIKRGREAQGPLAEPHEVGCSAQVIHKERLANERFNITAMGKERFRIVELDTSGAYLVGTVEKLPLTNLKPIMLRDTGRRLRPWVQEYLTILAENTDVRLDAQNLPTSPITLAYLAASVVQTPPHQQQHLLEINNAETLLTGLLQLYRKETALLRELMARERQNKGMFGVN